MNYKRLLTLDDLYNYYSNHSKSFHFNAEDEKKTIVVQVPGNLHFEEENCDTEGLLPVILQSCHTETNNNDSYIAENVMLDSIYSFKNRPILGYIHDVDGEPNFYKHNMHEDKDGNTVYDEVPIGIIPESCDAKLEYDEEKKKTYVVVKGYIFEEYSKAADILKREGECSVSVELTIREFSYNAKEKVLVIENFYFSGVTILGKDPDGNDVKPGMTGSNIKLADFSKKNNSMFTETHEKQMIEIRSKLDELISRFNIDNSKKGGSKMNHFEELLSKYGKTIEDIEFEYENMSNEELDDKFAELFEEKVEESVVETLSNEIPETTESDKVVKEVVEEEISTTNPEESFEGSSNKNLELDIVNTKESEKFVRTYELSHDDIRCALYNLLVAFEEVDNTYYWISDVYDDYFVYESYCGDCVYGQRYKKEEDVVSFVGERYKLYKELLTESEKAELERLRSDYSVVSEKLNQYEAMENENKKTVLLSSNDYASINSNEEFKSLVNNHENISFEELQEKCDKILLDAVKNGKFDAGATNASTVSVKHFANPKSKTTKTSRYGKLFTKKD